MLWPAEGGGSSPPLGRGIHTYIENQIVTWVRRGVEGAVCRGRPKNQMLSMEWHYSKCFRCRSPPGFQELLVPLAPITDVGIDRLSDTRDIFLRIASLFFIQCLYFRSSRKR